MKLKTCNKHSQAIFSGRTYIGMSVNSMSMTFNHHKKNQKHFVNIFKNSRIVTNHRFRTISFRWRYVYGVSRPIRARYCIGSVFTQDYELQTNNQNSKRSFRHKDIEKYKYQQLFEQNQLKNMDNKPNYSPITTLKLQGFLS